MEVFMAGACLSLFREPLDIPRGGGKAAAVSDGPLLSTKPIAPRDRLIFALDVPTKTEALEWIERLGEAVHFYKLGLEFCMSGEYFAVLGALVGQGKKVFADLKFADVPATVRGAVANLARSGATLCTLHATSAAYTAAVPVKGAMQLLAVTVLTSMDATDLAENGWSSPVEELVSRRARAAVAAGMDGLICSGQEAARLRRELGPGPLLVTPGIRAASERGGDDQKRTMTLAEAFRAGADHIVVGRPIRQARDPRAAAEAMQAEIAALFAGG
jgi:orotidine-5'-phosphate decarboxylase